MGIAYTTNAITQNFNSWNCTKLVFIRKLFNRKDNLDFVLRIFSMRKFAVSICEVFNIPFDFSCPPLVPIRIYTHYCVLCKQTCFHSLRFKQRAMLQHKDRFLDSVLVIQKTGILSVLSYSLFVHSPNGLQRIECRQHMFFPNRLILTLDTSGEY